jgi:beta-lactamase class A
LVDSGSMGVRAAILTALVSMTQMHAPTALERALAVRIAAAEQKGGRVAVALETLDGRERLLIQGDESFHAASTMKVPVMIELFREAHAGRLSLADHVPIVNAFHSLADGSLFSLPAGADADPTFETRSDARATYRELCESMITISSNLAANILLERLTPARVQATVDQLGASGMQVRRGVGDNKAFDQGLNSTTTARALRTLLLALAKGQVVDRASSAEMVAILGRQQARDGVPAGLPPGTPVAHKAGEITGINHDAAIVLGQRPYVLVVLTGGIDDRTESAALIADVTRIVDSSIIKK